MNFEEAKIHLAMEMASDPANLVVGPRAKDRCIEWLVARAAQELVRSSKLQLEVDRLKMPFQNTPATIPMSLMVLKDDEWVPKSDWTPCSERLPKMETPVLIMYRGEIHVGELREEHHTFEGTFKAYSYWDDPYDDGQQWEWHGITHWQPLPKKAW